MKQPRDLGSVEVLPLLGLEKLKREKERQTDRQKERKKRKRKKDKTRHVMDI